MMDPISDFSSKLNKVNVKKKSLLLVNDDFNDFDHVADCLVLICDHTIIQAEQCALIAHNVGQCVIKEGSYLDLINYKKDLTLYGLEVQIL